jgi:hypothetical protein
MQKFIHLFLKRKWLLEIVIVGLSFFCIYQGDSLRERISPNSYWSTRENAIQRGIQNDELNMEKDKILLDKAKAIENFKIQEAILQAEIDNKPVNMDIIKKGFHEKIIRIEKDLNHLQNDYQLKLQELDLAKAKLEHFQRLKTEKAL